jgi:hypothetical protein
MQKRRRRVIRQSGSEVGGDDFNRLSLPLFQKIFRTLYSKPLFAELILYGDPDGQQFRGYR